MRNNHPKIRFTRKLWNRWLERLRGPDPNDPQYRYLSQGIEHFRRELARREPRL